MTVENTDENLGFVIFCDFCNPDWDVDADRGVFLSQEPEVEDLALGLGWGLDDSGHICPLCIVDQKRIDEAAETVGFSPEDVAKLDAKVDLIVDKE